MFLLFFKLILAFFLFLFFIDISILFILILISIKVINLLFVLGNKNNIVKINYHVFFQSWSRFYDEKLYIPLYGLFSPKANPGDADTSHASILFFNIYTKTLLFNLFVNLCFFVLKL